MLQAQAHIASVGARTSVGLDALQTAMLFRAGACGMRQAPLLDTDGEPVTMCFVPTLDPLLTGWERAVKLALPALEEALKPISGSIAGSSVKLQLCIDQRLQSDPRSAAALVSGIQRRAHRLIKGIEVDVTARGPASAAICLPDLLRSLTTSRSEVVVLGAVHSDYEPGWISELSSRGRLFKPDNLDSFIPGELAVFVVIAREATLRRLGLSAMGGIVSAAIGSEAATPDNDLSAYDAKGLTNTVKEAAKPLVEAGFQAGWAFTDLTFEMRKVAEWQSMCIRTRKIWTEPYVVESPAQRIGQLGAAAIPLGMALASVGWRHRCAPSPIALVYAGSDSGERGATLLAAP